jgi:YD repeat-containing protein
MKGSPYWWAEFRGPNGATRKSTKVRNTEPSEHALAVAVSLEHAYLALVEHGDLSGLDKLVEYKVIDYSRVVELRSEAPVKPRRGPATIVEAAYAHEATKREELKAKADVKAGQDLRRHRADLDAFVAWLGTSSLAAMTRQRVLAYIDHLKEQGFAWSTRKHKLLLIRRAAQMAPHFGLQDTLTNALIDRRDEDEFTEIQAYDGPELYELVTTCFDRGESRIAIAAALMGYCGLRPSELARLLVGDYNPAQKVLRVGAQKRKNRASRRDLPLPATVAAWLDTFVAGRSPEEPLIRTHHPDGKVRGFEYFDLGKWWAERLRGLGCTRILSPKALRKTFVCIATWEARDIPERAIDLYMGHKIAGFTSVTNSAYLLRATSAMRVVAEGIEVVLSQSEKKVINFPDHSAA